MNFVRILSQFCANFVPILYEFCTNSAPTRHQLGTESAQNSYKIHTKFAKKYRKIHHLRKFVCPIILFIKNILCVKLVLCDVFLNSLSHIFGSSTTQVGPWWSILTIKLIYLSFWLVSALIWYYIILN